MLDLNILNGDYIDETKIKIKNPYILLAPEYFESKKNWHLFKAKIIGDNNKELTLRDYGNILGIYCHIKKNEVKTKEEDKKIEKIKFKLLNKTSECGIRNRNKDKIENENFESFVIEYNLNLICNFIGDDIYYTDENRTFFYSDDENIIRILACALGRDVCGVCMSKLYGDLDTKK